MAAKFLIGSGAGVTWDNSNDTIWSTSSGGANNTTHPVAGDTVTLDASSGGGVVTVNATLAMSTLTMGAFTGTLDFSVNNNNITLTGTTGLNNSGTGTRTLNLGNGTWFLTANSGVVWDFSTTTNLTFNANSSTIDFTSAGTVTAQRTWQTGGKTYATVILANASGNTGSFNFSTAASPTITTLTINAPFSLLLLAGTTFTVTTLSINGVSATNAILLATNTIGTAATFSVASGSPTITYVAMRDMTFSGGATFNATNSFDLKHNTGVTITGPSGGGLLVNPGMIGGLQ